MVSFRLRWTRSPYDADSRSVVGLHHAGRPGWRNTGVGIITSPAITAPGVWIADLRFGDRDTWEGNPRLAGTQGSFPEVLVRME